MRAMKLTRKTILDEIKTRPDFYDNKKLARALGVKGDDRRELRQLLRAMVEDGSLKKSDRKTFREADALPGVMVIKATRLDDGDLMGSAAVPRRIWACSIKAGAAGVFSLSPKKPATIINLCACRTAQKTKTLSGSNPLAEIKAICASLK